MILNADIPRRKKRSYTVFHLGADSKSVWRFLFTFLIIIFLILQNTSWLFVTFSSSKYSLDQFSSSILGSITSNRCWGSVFLPCCQIQVMFFQYISGSRTKCSSQILKHRVNIQSYVASQIAILQLIWKLEAVPTFSI